MSFRNSLKPLTSERCHEHTVWGDPKCEVCRFRRRLRTMLTLWGILCTVVILVREVGFACNGREGHWSSTDGSRLEVGSALP